MRPVGPGGIVGRHPGLSIMDNGQMPVASAGQPPAWESGVDVVGIPKAAKNNACLNKETRKTGIK